VLDLADAALLCPSYLFTELHELNIDFTECDSFVEISEGGPLWILDASPRWERLSSIRLIPEALAMNSRRQYVPAQIVTSRSPCSHSHRGRPADRTVSSVSFGTKAPSLQQILRSNANRCGAGPCLIPASHDRPGSVQFSVDQVGGSSPWETMMKTEPLTRREDSKRLRKNGNGGLWIHL